MPDTASHRSPRATANAPAPAATAPAATPAAAARLSPNVKLIGRYSILRELRRDRYTNVFLAFDPVLNRELIVKAVHLHPSSAQDRAAHERIEQAFMRQAQAAGRLHHPHIVTVFDAGLVNRIGYLALEKVDGKLLEELLAEGYRPGFLQAADIVARVADAVEFAHSRAIPHGHLSPSRIYLQGAERVPKVMGFGGWIDGGATGDFELQGTDRLLPYFGSELSSEVRRKDIRALGALLFLLLTGTRPDVKTLRVGKGLESPILQIKPNAPLALAEIAEQALELGGSRVFATAAQMRNALTTFLWGNRGDLPLPGATITGMPAQLAVMPKRAATLTVATLAARHAAPARAPIRWGTHLIAALAGAAAIAALAGIGWRTERAPSQLINAPAAAVSTPAAALVPAAESASPEHAPEHAPEAAPPSEPVPGERATALHHPAATQRATPRAAPEPAPAMPAAQGVVALAVAPWGTVFIDGQPRGTTPPLAQITLPAGSHTIEIRNGNRPAFVTQVNVTPDRPQQIRHRFD